jgi:hypothetical protein
MADKIRVRAYSSTKSRSSRARKVDFEELFLIESVTYLYQRFMEFDLIRDPDILWKKYPEKISRREGEINSVITYNIVSHLYGLVQKYTGEPSRLTMMCKAMLETLEHYGYRLPDGTRREIRDSASFVLRNAINKGYIHRSFDECPAQITPKFSCPRSNKSWSDR